jgi:hypothetical protein
VQRTALGECICGDLHHQRASNLHTRGCDAIVRKRRRQGASGNMRPRFSWNLSGSINVSVTFVAVPYALLK